jgi:RNA polymerase sigma-70 factor (ECF subfamily)
MSFPVEPFHCSATEIGVFDFFVPTAHPNSTPGRRLSGHSSPTNPRLVIALENNHAPRSEVLNCVPLLGSRGRLLQFHSFDENYLGRLREGDFLTQDHFRKYFTALMKVKLQSRLKSPDAIEDVQQETFMRFYAALREGRIREPKSLGSFVNSMCNNVLKESWRRKDSALSLDDDDAPELPAAPFDLLKIIDDKQAAERVRKVIEQLPERDRRVLRAIFFEERDKDEVCRELGITRDNLRLLLHRVKRKFRDLYEDGNHSLRLVPGAV